MIGLTDIGAVGRYVTYEACIYCLSQSKCLPLDFSLKSFIHATNSGYETK